MKPQFHVGIDVASESFTATVLRSPDKPQKTRDGIPNNLEGFKSFLEWLKDCGASPSESIICMEATGVYSSALCHFLASQGYRVAVEPPLKVKRAFKPEGHKTDPVDSRQIAEYAFRFADELCFWSPREETLEKLRQLLSAREGLVKQSTALKNSLQSFEREPVRTELVIQSHRSLLEEIRKKIRALEDEISRLISDHPDFRRMVHYLKSMPGVGLLLAAHLLVITTGFTRLSEFRQLASHLGICPYQRRSGKTIRFRDRSSGLGPSVARKLLHLAARSVATHNRNFRIYYLRKLEEGKDRRLVLNNISNKMLKVVCALVKSDSAYIPGHRSVNPSLLGLTGHCVSQ